MPIAFPPCSEQQAILELIDNQTQPLDTAISRLEREIELLREYRTRLVADVVTGKLDVREAAKGLPADENLKENGMDLSEGADLSDESEGVENTEEAS